MPTPRSESYTAASGASIYAGRLGPPSWLNGVASGSYVELPNSTFSTSGAGWTGTPPGGTSNYLAVVTPWCGGVLVSKGIWSAGVFYPGTFLVIWGGGHGDYAGNELYGYGPLASSSPQWRRITNPSIPAPVDVPRLNGYPVSRHTYDTLVYSPEQNKMYALGCPGYHNIGYNFLTCDVFDFSVNPAVANPWTTADTGFPAFSGNGTINAMTGLDDSGKAWVIGKENSSKLASLHLATNTWTTYNKDNPTGPSNSKAGLSPTLNLLVFASSTSVFVQNLSLPNSNLFTPTTTGTHPGESNIAMEWNPAGYFFCLASSGTVFKLTPGANPLTDAWAWTSVAATGATPNAPLANGTYGRFRYVKSHGEVPSGAIVMRRHDAPICFYKE